MVDGVADTVTVLGSAVAVTVGVTVVVEVGVTAPGSCTLGVSWTEKLTVAEKLALIDATGEVVGEGSVVMAVVVSVAVGVLGPGSAGG
ncbi:hypothetical protein [Nocardia sp. A7]|uniref:hypothetical protein n=1 Tax=Nocardia sp. A7 TaxID=2789274 RepID=UPI00397CE204